MGPTDPTFRGIGIVRVLQTYGSYGPRIGGWGYGFYKHMGPTDPRNEDLGLWVLQTYGSYGPDVPGDRDCAGSTNIWVLLTRRSGGSGLCGFYKHMGPTDPGSEDGVMGSTNIWVLRTPG